MDIKVKCICTNSLPFAWELALKYVWEKGIDIPTKYDKKNDPPSKDATVLIQVKNPLKEPMIHRDLPGGLEDLEIYCQEVINGIHDHWVTSPDDIRWDYSYHDRLFRYNNINQIKKCVIDKLVESYHNRRCQAITWQPAIDIDSKHSPCLQRLHFRMTREDDLYYLHMTSHWRSRDLYKAWFMNAYAFVRLQEQIAKEIQEQIKNKVIVGNYIDFSNSLHIYGSYFGDVTRSLINIHQRSVEERMWRSDDSTIKAIMEETRKKLAENPDYMIK